MLNLLMWIAKIPFIFSHSAWGVHSRPQARGVGSLDAVLCHAVPCRWWLCLFLVDLSRLAPAEDHVVMMFTRRLVHFESETGR